MGWDTEDHGFPSHPIGCGPAQPPRATRGKLRQEGRTRSVVATSEGQAESRWFDCHAITSVRLPLHTVGYGAQY